MVSYEIICYGYQDSSFGVIKVSVFANDRIVGGEQLTAANRTVSVCFSAYDYIRAVIFNAHCKV